MSKTDKTAPWKVQEARGEHARHHGYPCVCFAWGGRLKVMRRKHEGHARTQLRADLAQGRDPEPVRHRHRAQWDAW